MNTTELRDAYLKIVEGLPQLDRAGREMAAEYMTHSEAVYKDEVSDFLYVPKLYTNHERERFQYIASTTVGILEKLIQEYLANPDYRKNFDFPAELEELILLDPGYSCPIPIIRIDIFYNEDSGDFKFCEFNTDGSSAMNEDREASNALALTPSFKAFSKQLADVGLILESFELFDSWVDGFLEIYADSVQARKEVAGNKQQSPRPAQPNIVISDFMDISTPIEIERFAQHFRAHGLQVEVCDIRDLRFEASSAATEDKPALLTPSGMRVDALYRRAVTGDIMKHYDEVGDFLDAYRAEAFTLIGSFRTQLPHTKLSFEVLHLPQTLALLTEDEQVFVQAHVPYTARLNAELPRLREVLNNKDAWIIKPLDSYGSKGVWAGRELDQDTWEDLIHNSASRQDHIVQEYVEQYSAPNLESGFSLPAMKKPVEQDGLPQIKEYRDLTGLFVYKGQFKGLLARAGLQDRICAAAEGKCLGTFKVQSE
ncbi:MAG: tubulin--tyrosine ligase family protein [Coriobacteriia bacterium]|nr:tubulin--tyrosine ligase family protein [Coriobacteriia bacterium]